MPIEPGSPEWHARKARMLREEVTQPVRWWWVSFGMEKTFLGAALVLARGPVSAHQRTHELGINPGGQVVISEIGRSLPPIAHGKTDRLLSPDEVRAMDEPDPPDEPST